MRRNFLSLLSICVFASCSNHAVEATDVMEAEEELQQISVIIEPMQSADDGLTRAVPVLSGSSMSFLIYTGDTLGIFPLIEGRQDGFQQAFVITNADEGVTSFSFTGGGWGLKSANTYASYFPFRYMNSDASAIPMSFVGQKQVGSVSGETLSSIGEYCYMASLPTTGGETGRVSFNQTCMDQIMVLKLTMPAESHAWQKLMVCTKEPEFQIGCTIDLTDGNRTITPVLKSNHVDMELENCTTSATDQALNIYLALGAGVVTLSNTFQVVVFDENDNPYVATYTGTNWKFESSKLRGFTTFKPVLDESFTFTPITLQLKEDGTWAAPEENEPETPGQGDDDNDTTISGTPVDGEDSSVTPD